MIPVNSFDCSGETVKVEDLSPNIIATGAHSKHSVSSGKSSSDESYEPPEEMQKKYSLVSNESDPIKRARVYNSGSRLFKPEELYTHKEVYPEVELVIV